MSHNKNCNMLRANFLYIIISRERERERVMEH